MIELEFNTDKAYGMTVFGQDITYEDYVTLPIVRWCIRNIGPMQWPMRPGDRLCGEGWEVYADWTKWMSGKHDIPPRTVLLLDNDTDPKLITEFWIKFGL